ncbi:MAG: hypothetical protein V2A61_02925, partial [Calditrichota bacterium]
WERNTILRQFEYLEKDAPKLRSPKFVFAHILIPHPPYIFAADGHPTSPPQTLLGQSWWLPQDKYVEQLKFLNHEITRIVTNILQRSERSPVIILQGDHGSGSLYQPEHLTDEFLLEKMTIFNAYHLPGGCDTLLYFAITPVNSLRLVLKGVLGLDIPLLEDKSYFSQEMTGYDFTDVTDRIKRARRGG